MDCLASRPPFRPITDHYIDSLLYVRQIFVQTVKQWPHWVCRLMATLVPFEWRHNPRQNVSAPVHVRRDFQTSIKNNKQQQQQQEQP